jgi:hypothetical protein
VVAFVTAGPPVAKGWRRVVAVVRGLAARRQMQVLSAVCGAVNMICVFVCGLSRELIGL